MSDSEATSLLERHGLRPTRQRIALAGIIFGRGDRHVTAEELHSEAERAGQRVSLATVYNTLNHFRAVGLLREITVGPGQSWFDTNLRPHFHLFDEDLGQLSDLPDGVVSLSLPELPAGREVSRVDVIIRLGSS